jgi:hypothetical protein
MDFYPNEAAYTAVFDNKCTVFLLFQAMILFLAIPKTEPKVPNGTSLGSRQQANKH